MKKKIPLTFNTYSKEDRKSIAKIRKIVKKDCILDASVVQLYDYYYDKYKIELTKKEKNAILELAEIKHNQNKIEAEEWAKCGIFYLSYERLASRNRAKKLVKNGENWYFEGDITEVMECAGKLVANAFEKDREENQIVNHLRNYCKEISDG